MVDIFVDNMHLSEIQRKESEVLVFKNKSKDEAVYIPVSKNKLLNITIST